MVIGVGRIPQRCLGKAREERALQASSIPQKKGTFKNNLNFPAKTRVVYAESSCFHAKRRSIPAAAC